MRHPFPRAGRLAVALPAFTLLLGACADTVPTGAPAMRSALVAAGAPLLRWAPATNAPAASGFVATTDGRLLAVGDATGLLLAEQGTLRWRVLDALDVATAPATIASDAAGTLYVGTFNNGVLRSRDGGASWQSVGLAESSVRRLAVVDGGTVYAGAQGWGGGIMRSDDGGESWRMVFGPFGAREGIVDWISARKSDVLVGLYSQLPMYSRDAGATWEPLWALFELPEWGAPANHMTFSPNGALLAAWVGGIARSSDGGATFEHVVAGRDVTRFAEDAARGIVYAMQANGVVLRSSDDGITWAAHVGPFQPRNVDAFAVAPDGSLVLATWQGIWRTVPGA